MADHANGTTVVFGTSSYAPEVLGIALPGMSRGVDNTSHLATTVAHTFVPKPLVDNGEFTMDIQYDPNEQPPIEGPVEAITITWPIPSGDSSGATASFAGFVTSWDVTAENEELMQASVTVKISGAIVWSDSA